MPEAAHAAVRQRALEEKETVDRYLRRRPVYSSVILRSRYAEDALEAAVRAGVRQYVLIGAGFDSFFLRRPALARSSFRFGEAAFFAWLGVTMYLPMDANLATLRDIARSGAPGSKLVFTYLDQRALEPGAQSAEMQEVARAVTSLSEPFLSGFDPAALPGLLRGLGLELVEDLGGPQLVERYDASGANGLRSTADSRIALAGQATRP